jgi:hypothetical protein
MPLEKSESPFYVFKTHGGAEQAIQLLSDSGFDLTQLSLVGKGYYSDVHPFGFYTSDGRIKSWGGTGAFWGGIWGVLLMPAVFFLPGLGIMAMAGPVVAALVGALERAVVSDGVSVLGAALLQTGVSRDQAIKYEKALKADKYVLTVHGSAADLLRARSVLTNSGVQKAA